MTHAECCAAIADKFDRIVTKLQNSIFRRTSLHVTENGEYHAEEHEGYGTVIVDVPPVTITPTLMRRTFIKNGTYTPPDGFDGFSEVKVEVAAQAAYFDTNGTYDSTQDVVPTVGYNPVEVRVPNNITFDRFTGRYNPSTKNIAANKTWESTVSNAVMDEDTLPRSGLHDTSFLGTFYCKTSIAEPFTDVRMRMEVQPLNALNAPTGNTLTWSLNFKQAHVSGRLDDGKYAYSAMCGLRMKDVLNEIPDDWAYLTLKKIYTEVCTAGTAQTLDTGAVSMISAISNTYNGA